MLSQTDQHDPCGGEMEFGGWGVHQAMTGDLLTVMSTYMQLNIFPLSLQLYLDKNFRKRSTSLTVQQGLKGQNNKCSHTCLQLQWAVSPCDTSLLYAGHLQQALLATALMPEAGSTL